MFDVLMYLFETYIHTEAELRVDQDKLEQDLTDAGFRSEERRVGKECRGV